MKPKTLVLLLVAISCGLVAAWVASTWKGAGAAQVETRLVLVPKTEIKAGTKIAKWEDSFEKLAYPADKVKDDFITDPDKLKDVTISRNLPAGLPVTKQFVDSSAPTLQLLPMGYRAVAISANSVNAAGGFILPGNRVDAMVTLNDNKTGQRMTKVFLQNVLVLAVNNEDEKAPDKKTIAPATVLLALKPAEAERITWVSNGAQINLALRRPDDPDVKTKTPGAGGPFEGNTIGAGPEGGDSGTTVAMAPRPVAIKDVEIGTKIDSDAKFDEYFKLVDMPLALAETALTKEELLSKKGTFYCKLLTHNFPTARYLDVAPPPPEGRQVVYLFIRNGKEDVRRVPYDKKTGLMLAGTEIPAEQAPKPGEGQ
jgi:pilus assembly protein CpaB